MTNLNLSLTFSFHSPFVLYYAAGHATESFTDFVVGHGELWSAQMLSAVIRKVSGCFLNVVFPIILEDLFIIFSYSAGVIVIDTHMSFFAEWG